jgi:hypothetical protein
MREGRADKKLRPCKKVFGRRPVSVLLDLGRKFFLVQYPCVVKVLSKQGIMYVPMRGSSRCCFENAHARRGLRTCTLLFLGILALHLFQARHVIDSRRLKDVVVRARLPPDRHADSTCHRDRALARRMLVYLRVRLRICISVNILSH